MIKCQTGREAINLISAINIWTQYKVQGGELLARAPGGLTGEQKELIRENYQIIVNYLTKPPEPGICRRGHPIKWVMSQYGDWLCSCFYAPYDSQSYKSIEAPKPATANNRLPSAKTFWVSDVPALH